MKARESRRLRGAFGLLVVATCTWGCASSNSNRPPPAEEQVTSSGVSHFPDAHTLDGPSTAPTPTSMPVSMDGPPPPDPNDMSGTDSQNPPTMVAVPPPTGAQGSPAPELSAAPLGSGKVPTIASLKGKVVVVHFWASWCTPCAKSLADLNAFAAKNKKKGVVVIGVSEDDTNADAVAFAKKSAAKFTMAWDTTKQTAGAYHVGTMPSTYVIDRKGSVVDVLSGAPIDTAALAKRL